jgi:ATP-binding cassette subfamily B protein
MNSHKIKQHDTNDCGAACLASVGHYYRLKIPIARIRQLAGTDREGTSVLGLIEAAESMGLRAKAVRGAVEHLPKIPLPAIAHLGLGPQSGFHYVVIYKVKKGKLRIMDPASGSIVNYTKKEFVDRWTGVLVLLSKKEGNKILIEGMNPYRRFWGLIRPHRRILLQVIFGAIIYTILGLGISVYVQKIVDQVLGSSNRNLLNLMSLLMLGIIILQAYIGIKRRIYVLKTGQLIDAGLILGYYRHLLHLPQRFFDTMQVGEIISRINDAVKIRVFINNIAIDMLVNLFVVLFAFALMFTYSWKLASLVVLIIPFYLGIYLLMNHVNKKVERRLMEDSAGLESQLVESITHIRTVKETGLETYTELKTENRFVALLYTYFRSAMNEIFANSSTQFLASLFLVLLLWIGSVLVLEGEITTGELLSFYALMAYFNNPLISLIGSNKNIQNALIAADRLFEIMDMERDPGQNRIRFTKNDMGDICFENISFRYGSRAEIFKNFSLSIKQGQITAIVGESGSGKTTLTGLLLQLYPLNEGKIKIGRKDLSFVVKSDLRKIIGVIPQQVQLFKGSIIDNIAFGTTPDLSKIFKLSEELGISTMIEGLPHGYDTEIGENGATLSGGQKQRIAIARALYRSPEILILDEATSGLDSHAEQIVQRVVQNFASLGGTVILISHQLNNIIIADQILVLKQGRLVEKGRHQELLSHRKVYYDLWVGQNIRN